MKGTLANKCHREYVGYENKWVERVERVERLCSHVVEYLEQLFSFSTHLYKLDNRISLSDLNLPNYPTYAYCWEC